MTVRKPLKESADVTNGSVLSGKGADVGTNIIDENENNVADVNVEDDLLDEAGGDDTNTEVDDISDAEIDSMLNEADDDEDLEESQIENLGDKKAPPFTKEDGGKKEKKEAEEKDDKDDKDKKEEDEEEDDKDKKEEDEEDKKDDKKDDKKEEDEDEKDGKEKVEEDFDDSSEIIDPVLYADEEPVAEEFGAIPDVVPELPDEPVVDLGEDEGEIDLESDVSVPSYEVETPFILPESKRVVVAKGDMIFFCGRAKKDIPSFAESTFSQAVNLLVRSKNLKGGFLAEGKKSERVALIGRSCLVEVAKDWRMPGTDTVFEKGDILQIVSRKQVAEKEVKTRK